MAIIRWNPTSDPWSDLRRVSSEMDRLFRSALGNETAERWTPSLFPAMNLYTDNQTVAVQCEMPGVPQDKVDVSIAGDTLTIKGERQIDHKGADVSYHRRERRGGYFNRTITLPFEVDPEKARANYENGMLKVEIERAERSKPRQITVKAT